jgi:hypothetical protein
MSRDTFRFRAALAATVVGASMLVPGVIGGAGAVAPVGTTYRNPVIDAAVTAPYVLASGASWTAYGVVGRGAVRAWASTNGPAGFTGAPVEALPLRSLGGWADQSAGVRSVAVAATPGQRDARGHSYGYVLYYEAAERLTGRRCIGVAISAAAAGPFHGEYAFGPYAVPLQCAAAEPSIATGTAVPQLVWRDAATGRVATRRLSSTGLGWASGAPETWLLSDTGVERPGLVLVSGSAFLLFSSGAPATGGRSVRWTPCDVAAGTVTRCAAPDAVPWLRSTTQAQALDAAVPFSDGAHLWLTYVGRAPGSCEAADAACTGAASVRVDKLCTSQRTPRTNAPSSGATSSERRDDCLADVPLAKDPVGWDALRRLDLLSRLTQGVAAKQFSSFARDGSNGDGSQAGVTCRRMIEGEGCVIAEAVGAGEIDSIWMTDVGPDGNGDVSRLGVLTITVDGRAVVSHSLQGVLDGELGAPFAYPLVANAAQTHAAGYIKVPMPYRAGMRVSLSGTSTGGYYHVTYKRYADAMGVPSFATADTATDVLETLASSASGTRDPKPAPAGPVQVASSAFSLTGGAGRTIARLSGAGTITQLRVRVPGGGEAELAALRLRISFDGARTVDSPVGEFFGSGLGEATVTRALMFSLRAPDGSSYSWWPMPFAANATVELVNTGDDPVSGDAGVTWAAGGLGDAPSGHFHATSRREMTDATHDWTFLETAGTGKVVGVNHTMNGDNCGGGVEYLEGDDRTYVDGSRTPQVIGTGTEDLYEGGWYFRTGRGPADAYSSFSTPFNGSPAQTAGTITCGGGVSLNYTPYDVATTSTAAFRSLITDAVPFSKSLRFTIMHGEFFGANDFVSTYGSTTFWYGVDRPTSVVSDQLVLGDPASEQAHGYTCSAGCAAASPARPVVQAVRGAGVPVVPPAAAAPLIGELASGFESDDPTQYSQFVGALTSGSVTFTVAVKPGASGLTLRRLGDQLAAFQAVDVAVDGFPVGRWTQPLNNGSEKFRWLEDDFDIPAGFVAGRDQVVVTLTHAGPVAWQAAEYTALSTLLAPA